ncbi:MAG: hypothetical protein VKI83_03325 [Synechococcaceae cyanobacterium]|nr:hypothetical protein [Synechococcaceae cyanobacterium]
MQLSQLDPQHADRFRSSHALFYDLPDGRRLLLLSGVVRLDLKAPGWTNESAQVSTYSDRISLDLRLPEGFLAEGQRFRIDQAVPFVALSSLAGTTNVLWGVNGFDVDAGQPVLHSIRLNADLEVARSAEVIQGLSYSLSLSGSVLG